MAGDIGQHPRCRLSQQNRLPALAGPHFQPDSLGGARSRPRGWRRGTGQGPECRGCRNKRPSGRSRFRCCLTIPWHLLVAGAGQARAQRCARHCVLERVPSALSVGEPQGRVRRHKSNRQRQGPRVSSGPAVTVSCWGRKREVWGRGRDPDRWTRQARGQRGSHHVACSRDRRAGTQLLEADVGPARPPATGLDGIAECKPQPTPQPGSTAGTRLAVTPRKPAASEQGPWGLDKVVTLGTTSRGTSMALSPCAPSTAVRTQTPDLGEEGLGGGAPPLAGSASSVPRPSPSTMRPGLLGPGRPLACITPAPGLPAPPSVLPAVGPLRAHLPPHLPAACTPRPGRTLGAASRPPRGATEPRQTGLLGTRPLPACRPGRRRGGNEQGLREALSLRRCIY